MAKRLFLVGALVLGAADICYAANATEISSDGCVDKSGFETCIADSVTAETLCIKEANGVSEAIVGCGLGHQINQMNCYMSSCWNKVYSCEYSMLAAQYTSMRDLVTPEKIPFWPAPDNAPGGCSCNIGQAYLNASQFIIQSIGCSSSGTTGLADVSTIFGCTCCSWSGALSAVYDICPHNDPAELDLGEYFSSLRSFESQVGMGECSTVVNSSCVSNYGVAEVPGGTFQNPDTISSLFGTEPFSTTGGSLTTPPGGATMTWSIFSQEFTVTAAAAVNGGNSGGTSDVVVTTTNSAGQTVTSTSKSTATGTAAGGAGNSADNLSGKINAAMWVPVMIGALWLGL